MTARPLTRAEALDTLARCARESNEATYPLGVIESAAKRSGVGADRTAPQEMGLGTGLTGVDPENDARPLAKPNASAPALILRLLTWLRAEQPRELTREQLR